MRKIRTANLWLISEAALAAIEAAFRRNKRRTWWPLSVSPSLSGLVGRAKDYSGRYEESRERLFKSAGVRVRYVSVTPKGRVVGILTLPGEPLRAAWTRVGRTLSSAAEYSPLGPRTGGQR